MTKLITGIEGESIIQKRACTKICAMPSVVKHLEKLMTLTY